MLLAATDYTVVLTAGITGLTALASGVVGYLAARLQAGALGVQAAAETERLREQLERDDLRARAASYAALLDADRRLLALLDEHADKPPAAFDKWIQDLYNHLNAVSVLGSASVGAAAVRLQRIVHEVRAKGIQAHEGDGDLDVHELEAVIARWDAVRRDLIDAMRIDVAPDHQPLVWVDDPELKPAE